MAGLVLGLAIALPAFLPASWLAARIVAATGQQVQLIDPRGTVWNGSARLVLTGGAGSSDAAALPTRLTWRMRPGFGGLHVALASECCTPAPLSFDWSPRWRGASLRVADGRSQWPASLLAGLGTPWNTLQLGGALRLSSPGMTLQWVQGRWRVEGSATLELLDIGSRISPLERLGSYRLELSGDPANAGAARVVLSTTDGALRLGGQGSIGPGGFRFRGEAAAASEAELPALSNLLNIIGRRSGARSVITIG